MIHVRLTDPQVGALQCRDWSEEPNLRRAWHGDLLVFPLAERDALASEINDASNAEDEHAAELRRSGDLDCARLAARSARVLANLYGKVLRARSGTRAGKSGA